MEPSRGISGETESGSSSRGLVRATGNVESSLLSQWTSVVFDWTYSLVRENPAVSKALLPAPAEDCAGCRLAKKLCVCAQCGVCRCAVRRGTRHHCRRCWRPVCARCWPRPRHVRPLEAALPVCDPCAVPWGLASLPGRRAARLFWGLYALSRAAAMPCRCVDPSCSALTYLAACPGCGGPTVMTQPHLPRAIGPDLPRPRAVDRVALLDMHMAALRRGAVDAAPPEAVARCFRDYFGNREDVTCLDGVTSTAQAHDILLSLVCTPIAYEYRGAPNISLTLSDIPYARLLKINSSQPRYTIMEAPGKVKFVSFPGTHDWRTLWINFNASQTSRAMWTSLVEGITMPCAGVDNDGNNYQPPVRVCGSMCKVWEYKVHAGFAQEAKEVGFSLDLLARDLQSGYRLVLTGHSLGGAVAQLLTLELLERHLEMGKSPNILCITAGAPLIGDYQLARRVELNGWARYFHNIVYRSDIVPRLTCGNELTWKMAAQVLGRASQFCRNLRNWFYWRENGAQVASAGTPHDRAPDPSSGNDVLDTVDPPAKLPDNAMDREPMAETGKGHTSPGKEFNLVEYVDKTIRTGGDVLAEDEEPPLPQARRAFSSTQAEHPTSSSRPALHDGAEASAAGLDVIGKDERVHRRYACFGRYHFFEYCAEGYFSTSDSEVAFGLLKRGCSAETVDLQDHTMASYNRCIMLRLCGKRRNA